MILHRSRTTAKTRSIFSAIVIAVALCLLASVSSFHAMAYADDAVSSYQYLDLDDTMKDVPADQVIQVLSANTQGTTWDQDGWYIVDGKVTVDGEIVVTGNVNLLLCDGAELNSPINVDREFDTDESRSLTIYGQSNQTGALNANSYSYGIRVCGDVTVNGGAIYARSNSYAGIYGQASPKTTFTVNAGTVTAESNSGHGILADAVVINGGVIRATASDPGIGARTGNVTINGGDIDTRGGASGITAWNSNIEIYGGRVYAKGDAAFVVKNADYHIFIGENITRVRADYEKEAGGRAMNTIDEANDRPILVNAVEGMAFDRDDPDRIWKRIFVHEASGPFEVANFGFFEFPVPSVTIEPSNSGTVTAEPTTGVYEEKIVLHVTPDEGCALESITCTAQDGANVPIAESNGEYSFIMPRVPVTVRAVFRDTGDLEVTKTFRGDEVAEGLATGAARITVAKVDGETVLGWLDSRGNFVENEDGVTAPELTLGEGDGFAYDESARAWTRTFEGVPAGAYRVAEANYELEGYAMGPATEATDDATVTVETAGDAPAAAELVDEYVVQPADEPGSGSVSIANAEVVLSKTTYTYNGKVQKPAIETIDGKALKSGTDYTEEWSNASSMKPGTYTVTITGMGDYTGQTKATYQIKKAANPLAVKAKTATVKAKTLKKKNKALSVGKLISFKKKGQGAITYAKASGNKKIVINKKTGKVTIKKGLKKGTYKVKVKVKAAGNANYTASKVKVVAFKIKVR